MINTNWLTISMAIEFLFVLSFVTISLSSLSFPKYYTKSNPIKRQTNESFDDLVWFVSNGNLSSDVWTHFSEKHVLLNKSELNTKSNKMKNNLNETKSKLKIKNQIMSPKVICLIFRAHMSFTVTYWTTNDSLKETKFSAPSDAVWETTPKTCGKRYIRFNLVFYGIRLFFTFGIDNKKKIYSYVEIHMYPQRMRNSSIFEDFARPHHKTNHLMDSDYRLGSVEPSFKFAQISSKRSFWCPLNQVFEYRDENGRKFLDFEMSDIFFDAFRRGNNTNKIKKLDNCSNKWQKKIVDRDLITTERAAISAPKEMSESLLDSFDMKEWSQNDWTLFVLSTSLTLILISALISILYYKYQSFNICCVTETPEVIID